MRRIYYRVPLIRIIYYLPVDLKDKIFHPRRIRPPRSRILVGDGNFEQIGRDFLQFFVDIGQLKPDEKVLEVGCGIGRMAIPMTDFLSPSGSYDGFDLVDNAIRWCRKKITPSFENFQFRFSDIQNDLYNPKGRYQASQYTFPYPDSHFDLVILTSVFTHMLQPDLEHYVAEISRVLKSGGRCFATFFLLNDTSWPHVKSGKSQFKAAYNGCMVIDPEIPEAAIAYEENLIKKIYKTRHLEIVEPIFYGSWCPGRPFTSAQDIILAKKSIP
jgi:ubiquinone/menaquinone biosynthesis C-methylase UbiE